MDMESGFLSIESFLKALSSMQRQPKMDSLQGIFCWLALSFRVFLVCVCSLNVNLEADLSILELYILVCMHRLEDKEQSSYNFTSITKGRDCSPPSPSPLVIRDRKVN